MKRLNLMVSRKRLEGRHEEKISGSDQLRTTTENHGFNLSNMASIGTLLGLGLIVIQIWISQRQDELDNFLTLRELFTPNYSVSEPTFNVNDVGPVSTAA